MATPGMIRKVDNLGRIVIPHSLRKAMNLQNGDEVELHCDGHCLMIRKFSPQCVFCGSREELHNYREQHICGMCLQNLRKV